MNGTPKSPSLLIDSEWPGWAQGLQEQDEVFAAMAAELRRRCDALLDPGGPMYLDWDNLESPWWKTRMGAKQLVVSVWDLAMAANLFGDTRYSQLAVNVLKTLVEHNMAENSGGTCYGSPYKTWFAQPLDSGHASESLGVSLDLLLPFLDDEEAQAIGRYLKRFLDKLEEMLVDSVSQERPSLQNIPMIGKFSMGAMAAALEKLGIVESDKYLAISKRAGLQYLEGGGPDEGILGEGPMYGFACLKHIAVVGAVLHRRGDPAVFKSDAWDEIVDAYASQTIPCDGTPNPLNDCYPVRISSWLLAVARYRKNGLARWLWESIVQPLGEARWDPPVRRGDIRAPWWNGLVPHALASYDPEVSPINPAGRGIRQRRLFEVRGVLDERSGWEEDDWYLTVTCCRDYRWRSRVGGLHQQADRGHFSLYALGEQFAIDNGYGNEVQSGSTEVIRFGSTGEAHSVPEINGAMQKKSDTCSGFAQVVQGSWALLASMDYPECYDGCSQVTRTVVAVPDREGQPLYVVVHDWIRPRVQPWAAGSAITYGLLLHTHEANDVELIDRETADLIGGRKGNRCRAVMTSSRPGRFMLDEFLGHPRLRFQNQGRNLHAVTVLAPYRKDEAAPVFERSDPDNDDGFAARLSFRGIEDRLILCAGGSLSEWGLEGDAALGLVREGEPPQVVVVDGTFLVRDGVTLFESAKRTTYVGEARPEA